MNRFDRLPLGGYELQGYTLQRFPWCWTDLIDRLKVREQPTPR